MHEELVKVTNELYTVSKQAISCSVTSQSQAPDRFPTGHDQPRCCSGQSQSVLSAPQPLTGSLSLLPRTCEGRISMLLPLCCWSVEGEAVLAPGSASSRLSSLLCSTLGKALLAAQCWDIRFQTPSYGLSCDASLGHFNMAYPRMFPLE